VSDAAAAYIAEAAKPACSDADKWATSELGQVATFRRGVSYDSSTLAESPAGARAYLNMKSFLKNGGYNYSGLKYFSGNVSADDLLDGNCVLIANTDVTREGDIIGAPITLPLALAGLEVVCSHHVTALRLQPQCDAQFIFYLLCLPRYRAVMRQHARGTTVLMLDPRSIEHIRFEHPSDVAEQRKIGEVLETLDTTIRQTEAIIAKLKQVRQGLLHDLLTRGIDANGELRHPQSEAPHLYKQSPLGWIPKPWIVSSIDEACSHVVDCPHSTPVFRDDGVLVARTMHIKAAIFLESLASRVSEAEYQERIARLCPESGDVVFTREAPVGEAFLIPVGMKICLGQRVMLLRPRQDKLCGEFLVAQIYSGAVADRIAALTAGTTNPHLNVAEVRQFGIPLPPVCEQSAIRLHLSELNNRIRIEHAQVSKLHMAKSGLMDDLLTSRVRVTPLLAAARSP